MNQSRARRFWLVGLGAVAAPVLVASIAYACTSLATLSMPSAGAEQSTVSGTGKGFSSADTASLVEIHFASRTGAVLWAGRASAQGEISYSFQVPAGTAPGQYAVIATQTAANGNAVGGTPARAAFEVTGAPAAVATTPAAPVEQVGAVEPAPAATPVVRTAPAPRSTPVVRTPAPAAVAPAPAVVTPAPDATPAPAPVAVTPAPVTPAPVTPAPVVAPAPAPTPANGERSVMVNTASDSNGSPWLAIGLVGLGLVLSLGATALVLAGRRDRKAPAASRR